MPRAGTRRWPAAPGTASRRHRREDTAGRRSRTLGGLRASFRHSPTTCCGSPGERGSAPASISFLSATSTTRTSPVTARDRNAHPPGRLLAVPQPAARQVKWANRFACLPASPGRSGCWRSCPGAEATLKWRSPRPVVRERDRDVDIDGRVAGVRWESRTAPRRSPSCATPRCPHRHRSRNVRAAGTTIEAA